MSECVHSWIRSASKQFLWKTDHEEWVTQKSFLVNRTSLNVIATIHWAGRIDEYYCSKCTEDKVVKRVEEYHHEEKPEWWSELVQWNALRGFFFWPDEFENPGSIDYSKHLPEKQLSEADD